jgi:hypothetical protein
MPNGESDTCDRFPHNLMKRVPPGSASALDLDPENLGCSPNVITRICFRLLDILANLTGKPGSRARSSAPEQTREETNKPDEFEPFQSLIEDLRRVNHQRTISQETPHLEPPEAVKLVSEATVRNEKTTAESLREEWFACQQRMDEWRRLLPVLERPFVPRVQQFRFDSSRPLNGIIHYLADVYGDATKMEEMKVLTVSASSIYGDPYTPSRAVDQRADTFFVSQNNPGSWLCLDFHDLRVIPTSYTLQTRHDGDAGYNHPKSWDVEYSQTGEDGGWFALDSQKDVDLNQKSAHKTVEISNAPECRFVRVHITGLNHNNASYLSVGNFELYGTLLSPAPFPGSSRA